MTWILEQEAKLASEFDGVGHYLLDEAMTVSDQWHTMLNYEWNEVIAGGKVLTRAGRIAPLPILRDVADKIVAQNQKTRFKRKRTDLRDTLQARGLL